MMVPSLVRSLRALNPLAMQRNPVMFVAWLGAALTTIEVIRTLARGDIASLSFVTLVALFLWLTVWFATFAEALAEALAEARGRAQADSLRSARHEVTARKLGEPPRAAQITKPPSNMLRCGDHVLVEAGMIIPADGEVVEGVASVDESAVTGESAPVIRVSGGDRSAVTGGTRLLSDWIIVRVTADPGEAFLDRMISMVEGAARQRSFG
ncbi:MAG: hypothetical protein KF724_13735 [Phycisphaeraceae bacterium]|nr:hypothetical protein [Phycisphaeraceae bacterium]